MIHYTLILIQKKILLLYCVIIIVFIFIVYFFVCIFFPSSQYNNTFFSPSFLFSSSSLYHHSILSTTQQHSSHQQYSLLHHKNIINTKSAPCPSEGCDNTNYGLPNQRSTNRRPNQTHSLHPSSTMSRCRICGSDPDSLLAYSTPAIVKIRDWRLGCIKYMLMLMIMVYIVVYQLL